MSQDEKQPVRIPLVAAHIAQAAVSVVGIICIGLAMINPAMQSHFLAMAMFAFAANAMLVVMPHILSDKKPIIRLVDTSPEETKDEIDDSGEFVDASTGLANRRYMMMFLDREISRAQRSKRTVSLAIFDLDNSKGIRERHGNDKVDGLLAQMAESMKVELRDYDLVARYSPGRLMIVLPEAPSQTAFEIAERLHKAAISVKIDDQPIEVTVAVSTFPDHASTAEELVNSSHHALNRGRFTGANRVHSLHDLAEAS